LVGARGLAGGRGAGGGGGGRGRGRGRARARARAAARGRALAPPTPKTPRLTNHPRRHPHPAPPLPQCDGEWRYDPRAGALLWTIDLIDDTNRSGSLEFVVPSTDPNAFYPIEVSFSTNKTMCDIEVETVGNLSSGEPVRFGSSRRLATAGYQVV
jgi:hypothetical protein